MLLQLRAWLLVPAILLPVSAQHLAKMEPTKRPQVMETYGKLPLSFEANQGQTDSRVKFLSRGSGYTLFLTQDSAVLSLRGKKTNAALRMKVIGANPHAAVAGTDSLPGKSNYFVGNDPVQWRTSVPTYASVKYTGVYPGIDLAYHGNQRLLEYDFVVAPGADPKAIELRFQGAKKLTVNRDGALVIGLGDDEVIEHAPVVYQEIGGERRTLPGRYVLRGKGRVGFSVAEHDRSRPLVIDPELVYSTYLGGGGNQERYGIAVDASGDGYVTGYTNSLNFPTTAGTVETTPGGLADAFVSKLNPAGSALVYSTYVGGSSWDWAQGIAIDAMGNAYITGITWSSDFPTTPGAFRTALRGGYNAFVSKLNASGSSLAYSTYLAGALDFGTGIAVDASGNAYVTGLTNGIDFPSTPGAFQTTWGGTTNPSYNPGDVFVSKLDAIGSTLVYSTYLGGSGDDWGYGIAVDAYGNAYVTGHTTSSNFPTTPGAFQTILHGVRSAFVTKLNAAGSALVYSTYLGGGSEDQGQSIALDASGNAYVTGYTSSSDFPTTSGALQIVYAGGNRDGFDAFVTKLNATGSALAYSSYLGGTRDDEGYGIAVDAAGNAYVTGATWSSNFPTTQGAFQTYGGDYDAFVSKLNPAGSALAYSTYLGGGNYDQAYAIAVDASGEALVTGLTCSSDFPTTPGAFQSTSNANGSCRTFVSKLSLGTSVVTSPVTTATVNGPAGNNTWYLGAVTVTLIATAGSSPVSATYYSVEGGPYQGYGAPFAISGDGTHQLLFYSVDTAGHQETPHGQTIKIDATKPVSHVAALPATELLPNFTVQWSGTDATSGLRDFTIYVSDNGGPFALWQAQTTATQSTFPGAVGHTYAFYSIARDTAGNQEGPKTAAEASTTVVKPPLPVSHVSTLPGTETVANFIVQWSGTDTGGPGIQSFTIYVSDNGGAFTAWQNATTGTQAWLAGTGGHTYGFYSLARDLAGNLENPKSAAEATTTVAAVVPDDLNGDGQVNCIDIAIVKASFGKRTGQPGFDPRADVNHDGIVDIRDLAAVSQKLIPGTTCP